jgi:PAS domain S-box-containing protein
MRPGLVQLDSKFEALADSAPDAILTIDEGSTILSANPAAERIFGYAPSELVGQLLTVLIPKRLRAAHEAGVARYLRSGRRNIPWTGIQLPALTKDGREIPVEISFGEFVDEGGRHVFSGFVRDVSERVRHQRELEEARAAAERALKELTTLGRITDVALAQATYGEMLRELLRRLREELDVDEATVLLLDESRTYLAVHASDGLELDIHPGFRIPVGRGVTGRIASTGQPLVVEDLSQVEVLSPTLREQMSSLAAVPVRSLGEMIGVLHVGSRTRRRFTDAEVRLLEVVAERMAGVFARTRLYEEERRAREATDAARRALAEREMELHRLNSELEERAREEHALRTLAQSITGAVRVAEVMHQIVEGALSASGAAGAYVEQVVNGGGEVEVVAVSGEATPAVGQRVPYPGSLTEEIIARREPVLLRQMQSFGAAMTPYLDQHCHDCSVLVAPLLGGDAQVLGALVLLRRPDEPPFGHGVVNRVRTLADLASIALQRLVALAESERRRAEAEAAVRSRDEVLSIVSHDLRNPVSTVAMSASLLKDPEIPLTEEQRHTQLDVIARSAQRMNRLIQDLLDVARIEGGRLTITCRCEAPAALAAEACEAFRPIAAEKSQTLDCNVEPDLHPVYVDRDRVLQVLSNYLNNAIKFTPTGGCISARVERTEDGGVRFAVSDTGPGIAPENLPRVFTRFWQVKRTAHLGSGLGLAIARGIAEAHHGRVWVESTPGAGSTFFLELPHPKECG